MLTLRQSFLGALFLMATAGAATAQLVYNEKADPFTDKVQCMAAALGPDDDGGISVAWDGDGYLLYFVHPLLSARQENVEVTYRVDKDTPVTEEWFGSKTGNTVFKMWGYQNLANRLKDASLFAIRWKDANGAFKSYLIPLKPTTEARLAIDRVQNKCKPAKLK